MLMPGAPSFAFSAKGGYHGRLQCLPYVARSRNRMVQQHAPRPWKVRRDRAPTILERQGKTWKGFGHPPMSYHNPQPHVTSALAPQF